MQALVGAGYTAFAVNPLQAARYRERLGVSGAKSDAADAHMLADMVRTDAHQLRPFAGDSAQPEAVKVVTRTHKTLIWERTRATQRLRPALREYFPAALAAFEDLDAADTLELLLRAEQLGQPAVVTAAHAVSVRALVAVLATLNEQVKTLQGQVGAHFGQQPDAEIILSQPGLGAVLGAPVLAEFGDAKGRYASAKAGKDYAGTSPITRASGTKKTVAARFVHNDRLIDAPMTQAFTSLRVSPGARAYYDRQRARGAHYNPALRQLANRLVGILPGCLKTSTPYDETTAWSHHLNEAA